jgi:DNA ligase D-like protein (predicted 3'-phosphoesterase)
VARAADTTKAPAAIRALVRGDVQGVGFRDATVRRARELGAMGWVRHGLGADGRTAGAEGMRGTGGTEGVRGTEGAEGTVQVHAEGTAAGVDELVAFLRDGPPGARVAGVDVERVAAEGHEQFAIRGAVAGVFVVQEHAATAHHFDLRLEVGGVMRSWALPRGPSMDPAVKRLAIEVGDHSLEHNSFEGGLGGGGVIVWDRGTYEQGGRVAWPEALERGHAVFVLHGEKLRGGFALQRTRRGDKPQWLLIKRRDPSARPGSDVVGEEPRSVVSARTLDELL